MCVCSSLTFTSLNLMIIYLLLKNDYTIGVCFLLSNRPSDFFSSNYLLNHEEGENRYRFTKLQNTHQLSFWVFLLSKRSVERERERDFGEFFCCVVRSSGFDRTFGYSHINISKV